MWTPPSTSIQDGQDLLRVLTTEDTTQKTIITGVSATNRTEKIQDSKIRQSEMLNQIIRFPRRQHQHLVSNTSSGCPKLYLLLMNQGGIKIRHG
jgi:hypothetical protein